MQLYKDFYYLKVNKSGVVDSSSIVAIRDPEGLVCIEIGGGGEQNIRQTIALFEQDGLKVSDIHTIIITHTHADHMGSIAHFKRLIPDLKIMDHEVDAPYLQDNTLLNGIFDSDLVARLFPGNSFDILEFYSNFCPISEAKPDKTLLEGDRLAFGDYLLEVIHTPGHHPGHISLYERNRGAIFVGDMLGMEVPFYTPSSGGVEGYLASMEKYLMLKPTLIIPSHGDLIENSQETIEAAERKVNRREQRMLEALGDSPRTFHELLPELFRSTLQHMFPGAAILASHLAKLKKEGAVEEQDGCYRLSGRGE
jgi:glyoxylase-like metal-dependent hydrolase (beta-lactamase superfamily II)